MSESHASGARQLAPWPRLLRLSAAFTLFTAAGPGVLARDGNVWLAALAIALWAATVARGGRRAVLVEWLVGAVAMGIQIWWIGYVLPLVVPISGLLMGAYVAIGGPLLRRLVARGWSLSVAAPLAWLCAEGLQHALPIPFSWGWMRLGHVAAGESWLIGSARVFGAIGLTAVVAGAGGALADLVARRLRPGVVGLLSWPAAAIVAGAVTAPPAMVDGPTLMLVQPAIPMARKQGASWRELLESQRSLTLAALDERARAGLPPPDAVVWAETMLPIQILGPGVEEAARAGTARLAPWHGEPSGLLHWPASERDLVQRDLLGNLLPRGTGFLAGVEEWVLHEGSIRRTNVGALWQHDRERRTAPKTYLVIGGETSYGLDELDLVRDLADRMAGYVPDLLAGEETGVLELVTPRGTWSLATTICFDNAFVEPYTGPLRRGRVDAHVVLSNEAWYRHSFEFDQMMAFSRVVAAATGRSVVRATNSGVTGMIGPGGEELARFEVDGEDREVAGTLTVTVPVPRRSEPDVPAASTDSVASDRALAPVFTRLGRWWTIFLAALAIAAGPLLVLVPRTGRSRRA